MSLRIRLVSDLHYEFHPDHGVRFTGLLAKGQDEFDVLVVAGDLCSAGWLYDSLEMLCTAMPTKKILYVLGNHEGYGTAWMDALQCARDVAYEHPNLIVLEQEVVTIGDQRFVGCTLWYPYDMSKRGFPTLGDFRYIKDIHQFLPDTARASEAFLTNNVQEGDVVITHHLPHPRSIHPKYAKSDINWIFLHDVSPIVEKAGAKLWIHGHSHSTMSYQVGTTIVRSNPYGYQQGYAGEPNPDFSLDTIIEV